MWRCLRGGAEMRFGKTDSPHGNKTRLMRLACSHQPERKLWPGCRDATRDKRGGPPGDMLRADGSCVLRPLVRLISRWVLVLGLRQLHASAWRFVEVAEASISRFRSHALAARMQLILWCFLKSQLNLLEISRNLSQSMRVSICATSAKIVSPICAYSITFGVGNLGACLFNVGISELHDSPYNRDSVSRFEIVVDSEMGAVCDESSIFCQLTIASQGWCKDP